MIKNFIDNHFLMDKITLRDKLMNQTGGGDNIFNKYVHYVIGIILIVIGIILIKSEDEWEEIDGLVKNINCINNNENSCNLLVEYNISNTQFIK